MTPPISATLPTSLPEPHSEQQRAATRKSALSGFLGTALEYYDFVIYGLAAATIFNTLFFPEANPAMGILASFATYAVGFAVRPLGGFILGGLGDRIGRKQILMVTILLMGVSTFLIGFLPTYAQAGIWAPALLITLRMLQGFGAGAELSSAATLLIENAPTHRRGLMGSLLCIGTNTGTLAASAIWLGISMLPTEEFHAWGWRIPFWLSIVVVAFGLWMRRDTDESETFAAIAHKQKHKTLGQIYGELLRHGRRPFLACLGLRLGEAGPSMIWQVFIVGYIASHGIASKTTGTLALVIASVVGYVSILGAGWLIDHYGRKPVYVALTALQFLLAFPTLYMVNTGDPTLIVLAFILGLSLTVLSMYAVESVWMAEIFGSRYRLAGVTASKEIGGLLGAGVAPFICAALVAAFDAWWPVAVYIMVLSLISFGSALVTPRTKGRSLTHEHDAL